MDKQSKVIVELFEEQVVVPKTLDEIYQAIHEIKENSTGSVLRKLLFK